MRTMGHSDERKGSVRAVTGPGVIYLVAGGRAAAQVLFSAMLFALCFGKGCSTEAAVQIRLLFIPICPEWQWLFRSYRVLILLPLFSTMPIYFAPTLVFI